MTKPEMDATLQNTTRLMALAFLTGCQQAEFGAVRDHCEVSDPTLSKAVATLEHVGYVAVRKGYVGKYPRTWLAATKAGRVALDRHLQAVSRVVDAARAAGRGAADSAR
jgi:DNA-binding MarR family transcriptional regulator